MNAKTNRYLFVLLALILSGIYVAVWTSILQDATYPEGTDFGAFASAATVIQEHGYRNLYDFDLQQVAQKELAPPLVTIKGGLLAYNHPPLLTPLLHILVTPDLFQSYLRWNSVNVVVIALCAWLSFSILVRAGWQKPSTIFLIVPLVLLFPTQINMQQGQDALFILLGLLIFLTSLQTDNLMVSGIGLGLLTISPHLAIILGLPWFFSQRQRFYRFVLWGGLFALFSIWLVGVDGAFEYVAMLSRSAAAEGSEFGINKIRMYNFSSIALRFWRTMPFETLSAVTWAGYIFGIGFLCWLHHKFKQSDRQTIMLLAGLTVMIGLFFAPHLHIHSWTLIWVPFLVLGRSAVDRFEWRPVQVGIALLLASLVMTPIFFVQVPLRSLTGFFVIFVTFFLLQKQLQGRFSH